MTDNRAKATSRYRYGFMALAVWVFALGLYGVLGPHTQREYITYVVGVFAGASLILWQRLLLHFWRFNGL